MSEKSKKKNEIVIINKFKGTDAESVNCKRYFKPWQRLYKFWRIY